MEDAAEASQIVTDAELEAKPPTPENAENPADDAEASVHEKSEAAELPAEAMDVSGK